MNTKKKPWLEEDSGKVINWHDNTVRWLVYHYLVGTIIALYLLMIIEGTVGWPFSYLSGLLAATVFIPIPFDALCLFFARRDWLKGIIS